MLGSVSARLAAPRLQLLRFPAAQRANYHAKSSASAILATKSDILLRTLNDTAEVSVLVVDGTQLVSEAVRRHKTAPTASAALGRALLGTLLLASFRKDGEQVQLFFRGDGPLGHVMAVGNTEGQVRGKVGNPAADPPLKANGKLDVGGALGAGDLAVVRSYPKEAEYIKPYTGMTALVSGEIAEDIAHYLVESEQSNSALGLGVSVSTADGSITAAGGFLVQVLPFCSEETLAQLEKNLGGLQTVSTMLGAGMSAQDITDAILNGLGQQSSGDRKTITPRYGPCEPAELEGRMLRTVAILGSDEIRDIVAQEGKIEVTCDFCAETYTFSEKQALDALAAMQEESGAAKIQGAIDKAAAAVKEQQQAHQ